MYICACKGVTDRVICAPVANGACTLREVARWCGAATGCGAAERRCRKFCGQS